MRTNQIKNRAIELLESGRYEEEKAEAFKQELNDYLEGVTVEEADIDFFQGFLDTFTFKDEDDWAFDAVQSELDDIGDQQHEQMRDERVGL